MATSVLKLVVDDKEYSASLKNAKQGMQDLQRTLQSAGKSFEDCDAAVAEYARGLGQMETTSRTARGEISELSSAFIELSRVYGQMSDQEKASPVGQALSKSLDELKTRTVDAKAELGNLNKQLEPVKQSASETGGVMEKLAQKFTLNLDVMKLVNVGLQAVEGALNVVKDAFFANESQVDEWGRTVESGRSIYNGFLQALNSGNFSGFFNNMDNLIAKARAAYDAMDELNTMMTIINPERAKLQAQQQQLRSVIRREGANSAAGKEAQGKLEALEPQMQRAYFEESRMNMNVFKKQVEKRLAEGQIWLDNQGMDMLMRSLEDSQFAMQMKSRASGSVSRQWHKGTGMTTANGAAVGGSGFWTVTDTRNIYQRVADLFTDEWRQQFSPYLTAAYNAEGSAYGVTLSNARYLNAGRGGGGGGRTGGGGVGRGGTTTTTPQAVAGSIDAQAKKVQELQKAWRAAADDDSREKIKTQLEAAQAELEKMEGKVKAPEGSLKGLNEELSKLQQEQQLVTTSDDWAAYDKKIAAVQKRIKELKGEMGEMVTGFAGLTNNSLGAWMSGQQSSLNNAEIGSEEYQALSANILDTKTLQNLLNTALKNDITISPDTLEDLWGRIIGGENIPDEEWQKLVETINAAIADLDIKPLKIDVESGAVTQEAKQVSNSWRDAARAVGAVGSALNQLENPAAKVAGIVGQAIANIALGFAQATAKSSSLGIFGWIAAIAGGLGTMISTISAIKSATAGSYAEGGIVPGNNYSDGLIANVSSGELILNRAQQDSVARQLTNGIGGNLQLSAVVTGEQIRLALNNNSRRIGRGEYVTTKG